MSIRNKITPDTKIRIAILHQLGSIFTESNNGGSYKVCGFVSRPLLITIPPKNSTGRQRTYTFMQAVTTLPSTFNDEHLTRIYQVVSSQQLGKLQSLFVVLNDDDRERCLELVKQKRSSQHQQPSSQNFASSSSFISGALAGTGSGMDLQALAIESLLSPPPPPPPSATGSGPEATEVTPRDGDTVRVKEKDKVKDKERDKVRDRSRSRSRDHEKSGRGERRRRQSSSSSSDHRRRKSKKSKKKRKRRQSTSESSSDSSSNSTSTRSSHAKEAEDKSRTRER